MLCKKLFKPSGRFAAEKPTKKLCEILGLLEQTFGYGL